MIRLVLRRDRVWLPVYLLSIAGFVSITVSTIRELLPTPQALRDYAADTQVNPVILIMQGPAYGDSLGAVASQQRGAATMIFAALGSVILLIKHTRGDEEKGRRELVGSAPISRRTPLTAALGVVFAANAVLALLIALVCMASGLPLAGGLAWGLMAASAGWFAAALAAVFAQVSEHAGAAGGGAFGLFFALYLLRGAGDMTGAEWLGWSLPTGWILRARPFADERWWVFLPVVACVAVLIALAYVLSARRDVGSGMIPARSGPAHASPYGLRGAFGLTWRLERGAALTWIVIAAVLGAGLGAGGRGAVAQLTRSGSLDMWAARVGTDDPGEIFFGLIVYILAGYSLSFYGVMAALSLRSAETRELLLAGPVGRTRWAASHLVLAFAVPAIALAVVGFGLSLDTGEYARMFALTLALVPAVWVVAGAAVAAYGLLGRAGVAVAWAILAVVIVIEVGWEIGVVSTAQFMVSPFAHVHYSVIADPGPATFAGLTLVAALLVAVGLYGLGRRDLTG